MTTFFDKQNSLSSDSCWTNYKNYGNDKINNYQTYDNQLVDCIAPNVRMPTFMYDHINLRGRPGVGVADSCLIDNSSDLLNNRERSTRDRCKLQLFRRLFNAGPTLKGQTGDIDRELDILSGSDSGFNNTLLCKKTIMEQQIKNPVPLFDWIKEVQNPNNIVPVWTNGGEDTRSYINRLNFNKNLR
jgi:hypothetical protein